MSRDLRQSAVLSRPAGYDVVRLAMVLLLLLAAGLKGYQLATEPVRGSSLLQSRWFLILVVEFELLFSFWLLADLYPRITRWFAMACFSAFAALSCYKALSGAASCGCFGRVQVNPWCIATLDLAIVLSLLHWRPEGRLPFCAPQFSGPSLGATSVFAMWLSVAMPAGFVMGTYTDTALSDAGEILGDGRIVVLKPETWIGKSFPLLPYVTDAFGGDVDADQRPLRERLSEGEWIVLLYHHGCPKCQEAIRDLPQIVRQFRIRDAALIELPPYGNATRVLDCLGMTPAQGRLVDTQEWFAETPMTMVLRGGVLTVVALQQETEGVSGDGGNEASIAESG